MSAELEAAPIVPAELIAEAAADMSASVPSAQPKQQPDKPPAPIDYTGEARGLIDLAIDGLAPVYPSLGKVWTPEIRGRVADAAGKVLAKYGIDMAGLFGRFAPEIGLAIVLIPLAGPTVAAILADRAQLDAKGAPPAPPPAADADPQPNPLGPFAGGLNAA